MARLKSSESGNTPTFIQLLEKTTVGRDPTNSIVIADDSVSRYHAEILRKGDGYAVVDLKSSNGTTLNGEKVESAALKRGDVVSFAGHTFVFEDDLAQIPPDKTIFKTFTRELLAIELRKPQVRKLDSFQDFIDLCELCAKPSDRKTFCAAVVNSLLRLSQADVAALLMREGSDWRIFSPEAGDFVELSRRFIISQSILERASSNGEGLLMKDPQDDQRFRNRQSIIKNEISTAIAMPFDFGGSQGMLYAHRYESALSFDDDDMKLLFAISFPVRAAFSALERIELLEFISASAAAPKSEIIGEHPTIRMVHRLIGKLAPTESAVLISGETGTGKELVARELHRQSKRSAKTFEAVNCAAISESLVESELFGHEKGAFTGAETSRPGAFELADGGSLFLDEIGELSLKIQAKLLRVLEDGEVRRVGGSKSKKVSVRVISASNRDLEQMVKEQIFRADLYFRLNVMKVSLPPLRERVSDIPLLAEHFLRILSAKVGRKGLRISNEGMDSLKSYWWPGNVREMRNVLERAVILVEGEGIGTQDLALATVNADMNSRIEAIPDGNLTLEQIEKSYILRVLNQVAGNKSQAAQILGIDRSTLYAKLKQYDLV